MADQELGIRLQVQIDQWLQNMVKAAASAEKLAAVMDRVEASVRASFAGIEAAAKAGSAAAASFVNSAGAIAGATTRAGQSIDNLGNRATTAMGRIRGSATTGQRAFAGMENAAADAGRRGSAAIESMAQRTGGALNRILGPLEGFKTQLLSAFGIAGIVKAVDSAGDFERSMADVNTLLAGSEVSLGRYRDQVLSLASNSSRGVLDLTKGLYDTLSSGIPSVEGAAGAFATLEASAKAAAAGGAETADVVRTVTAVLNAYRGSGLTAAAVTDKLRVAIDKGVTTMPELASSLGQIVGISSGFGVSLDEVLATMAQLTLGGLSTSESLTSIRQIMVSLARPPKEVGERFKALGIEFGVAALKSKQLTGVLQDVIAKTNGSASEIAQLFTDVDGLKGVLSLTSQGMDSLAGNLDAVKNSAGATDRAAKIVNETFSEQWKILKNRVGVALIEIGTKLMPLATDAMNALSGALQDGSLVRGISAVAAAVGALGSFIARYGKEIIYFFTFLAGVKLGGALLSGLASLKAQLAGVGTVTSSVKATAARFGQDYGLAYGGGVAKGAGLSGGKILASLKGALTNPSVLAVMAAVGVTLGQTIGNAIGESLVSGDSWLNQFLDKDFLAGLRKIDKKAQDEIKKSEADMGASAARKALNAGYAGDGADLETAVKEYMAARDALASGAAVLLKGTINDFRKEDVVAAADALTAAGARAKAAVDAANASAGATIGDLAAATEDQLQAGQVAIDAKRGELTKAKAGLEAQRAAAEKVLGDLQAEATTMAAEARLARGSDAGKLLDDLTGRKATVQRGEAEAKIELLNAEILDLDRRIIIAGGNIKAFEAAAKSGAESVGAEGEAKDRDLKALAKQRKEEEKQRKKESEAAAKERERAEKEAAEDLVRLSNDVTEARIANDREATQAQIKAIEERAKADEDAAKDAMASEADILGIRMAAADQTAALYDHLIELAREQATAEIDAARDAASAKVAAAQGFAGLQLAITAKLAEDEKAVRIKAAAEVDEIIRSQAVESAKNRAAMLKLDAEQTRRTMDAGFRGGPTTPAADGGGGTVVPEVSGALSMDDAMGLNFGGGGMGFQEREGLRGQAQRAEAERDRLQAQLATTRNAEARDDLLARIREQETAAQEARDKLAQDERDAGGAAGKAALVATGPIGALMAAGPAIMRGFGALLRSGLTSFIEEFFDAVLDVFLSLFEGLPDQIETLIGETFPKIVETLIANLPRLITGFVLLTPRIVWAIVQGLITGVPRVVEALGAGLVGAFEQIGEWLASDIGQAITGAFAGAGQAIIDGLVSAFEWIVELIKSAVGGVGDVATGGSSFWGRVGEFTGISGGAKILSGNFEDLSPDDIPVVGPIGDALGWWHQGGVAKGGSNPERAASLAMAGAHRYATGGMVSPLSSLARRRLSQVLSGDDIPALLAPGEGVLTRAGVDAAGGEAGVAKMNRGGAPGGAQSAQVVLSARVGGDAALAALITRIVSVSVRSPSGNVRAAFDQAGRATRVPAFAPMA